MPKPRVYVVSEDLHVLVDRWSEKRLGMVFDLSYERIRRELAEILTFGGHCVVRVTSEQMRSGISRLLEGERRPVVSVDPVYWPSELMLQITRCVHADTLEGIDGFHSRYGFPHPDAQVSDLVGRLRTQFDEAIEVVLVDDVVFSGKVVVEVIRRLSEHGVRVARVVCGIAVCTTESDPFAMCAALGTQLEAAFRFGGDGAAEVVDEICERDFFVFCPMCGRSAVSDEVNLGFPYVEPFGLAGKWASFGDHAWGLSTRLIELNVRVLEEMERQLGRDIAFGDLERHPVRVRHPEVDGESVRLHLLAHLR
ncbi:hypothetical protein A2348_00265 [Candidatus Uhrbacteria bacterium RIFOXYB12_FULL_58_10]|uniref:Phosphoribosyltransferase domain-containing protein n=1 Tax=Candidatus Uhrbacteria bacterium RIFOXYB2_FULL_57_15 TaxID=1802422 RepID=A0A1F7W7A5_9BACT|nr:MAG: hypothetical protein A2348_00265 [Candidatus Uhrbacteria bacterium RIFOXYB12_FULL_58_10]OGL98659.1 MAG: hypothetical protein A2304_03075 [Candidatus Uhrbacteria bacterium RIFOXYB2_FULL_57_15]OGM00008.1 MAG: hypothetical protein A2501_02720 [Candidatus Uhrbacteria bacterium RIFOXYC12_FULL_57_11]